MQICVGKRNILTIDRDNPKIVSLVVQNPNICQEVAIKTSMIQLFSVLDEIILIDLLYTYTKVRVTGATSNI